MLRWARGPGECQTLCADLCGDSGVQCPQRFADVVCYRAPFHGSKFEYSWVPEDGYCQCGANLECFVQRRESGIDVHAWECNSTRVACLVCMPPPWEECVLPELPPAPFLVRINGHEAFEWGGELVHADDGIGTRDSPLPPHEVCIRTARIDPKSCGGRWPARILPSQKACHRAEVYLSERVWIEVETRCAPCAHMGPCKVELFEGEEVGDGLAGFINVYPTFVDFACETNCADICQSATYRCITPPLRREGEYLVKVMGLNHADGQQTRIRVLGPSGSPRGEVVCVEGRN
ncbi:MAG: hypothetical protein RMJ84_03975 [Sandaracinaceae bacterium]|nr:hypothetical protein [Sandaracinaceae bacterium]